MPTSYFQGTYNQLCQIRCPQGNAVNVIMRLVLEVLEEGTDSICSVAKTKEEALLSERPGV